MNKPIKITQAQWFNLKLKLAMSHSVSTLLIREKMQRVLGFTDRAHTVYNVEYTQKFTFIYLDFFNEAKRTMFILKYSDFLENHKIVVDQI